MLVFLLIPSLINEHRINADSMSGGKIAGISIAAAVVFAGLFKIIFSTSWISNSNSTTGEAVSVPQVANPGQPPTTTRVRYVRYRPTQAERNAIYEQSCEYYNSLSPQAKAVFDAQVQKVSYAVDNIYDQLDLVGGIPSVTGFQRQGLAGISSNWIEGYPDVLLSAKNFIINVQSANAGLADSTDFSQLYNGNMSGDSISTFNAQVDAINGMIRVGVGQGLQPSDIINMAKNSDYLPDEFSGSLLDAVKLISQTVASNSIINADMEPAQVKELVAAQQVKNAAGPGGEPVGGAPVSGPSTGGAGDIASSPSYKAAMSEYANLKGTMSAEAYSQRLITDNRASAQSLSEVQDQIKALSENSPELESLQTQEAQYQAEVQASNDAYKDATGEDIPVE